MLDCGQSKRVPAIYPENCFYGLVAANNCSACGANGVSFLQFVFPGAVYLSRVCPIALLLLHSGGCIIPCVERSCFCRAPGTWPAPRAASKVNLVTGVSRCQQCCYGCFAYCLAHFCDLYLPGQGCSRFSIYPENSNLM